MGKLLWIFLTLFLLSCLSVGEAREQAPEKPDRRSVADAVNM